MAQRLTGLVVGLVTGLLFGLGLTVSQMVNPAKVLGFLDVTGAWDPSLALVMGGALVVTLVGYRLVWRRAQPLFGDAFAQPAATALDGRLLGGAAIFGVGWGLVGFCPGPALSALTIGGLPVLVFVLAMAAGMALVRLVDR